jgi:hypothetical protein
LPPSCPKRWWKEIHVMISLISTKWKSVDWSGERKFNGKIDNFTRVLNKLAGSEAMSMIYVWLSYESTWYTMTSNSFFNNIYILNQQGIPLRNYVTYN